jgi:hypothetical protein
VDLAGAEPLALGLADLRDTVVPRLQPKQLRALRSFLVQVGC